MSKIKKIVVLFSTFIVLAFFTSFNTFALTSTKITFSPATNGYVSNGSSIANVSNSNVGTVSNYDYVTTYFSTPVSQPERIGISIPFSFSVPEGNYWSSDFGFYVSLGDGAGNYQTVILTDFSIACGTDSTNVIYRYSDSNNSSNTIPVHLQPNTLNGSLHFLFTIRQNIDFTVKSVIFRFYNVSCQYGLESEFSQINEKNEVEQSGNDSLNDVSSSVPDKSAGMLSALQSLSNAVSYTGTTAKWTFPQMYIPAIAGVTDRINLNSEMEIDFTYWVNQIPKDIRTLISAIATIGLVIFAFKELYGLISYVLTLKGGGNNE